MLLGLLAAGVIAYFVARAIHRRKHGADGPAEPPRPPEETALEAIQKLESSGLLEQGHTKEFYFELGIIFRRYLEQRYALSALDRTTSELYADFREMKMSGDFLSQVRPFFDNADLVKFAEIPVRLPQGLEIAEAALVPIQVDGEHLSAVMVSMGNPHCVIFTSAAVQKRVAEIGPKLERHMYFPERANIMLARLVDDHTIEVAHWERGSGLTLACGSGACATAAAAIRRGIVNSPVTIKMSGGDINILWDGAREDDLWMSGPTAMVFKGEFYFKESSS
jgi:hypothetical protein